MPYLKCKLDEVEQKVLLKQLEKCIDAKSDEVKFGVEFLALLELIDGWMQECYHFGSD